MPGSDLLRAPFRRALWKKRRVLILGLGQYPNGSGVSAALLFAKLGADVRVTDLKSARELASNVARLKRFKNVACTFGRHDLKDIRWAELIVANPRVRPQSDELMLARRLNTPVTSDIGLFLDRCTATVVAVTGTRGKSTTASLIAHLLRSGGRRVWLGGNILISPLTFLDQVKRNHVVVLELSSWQCESLARTTPPHIAVVTNLMRDHLNTYDGMEDYAEAKAQIFRHQNPSDIAILNADDAFGRRWLREAPGRVMTFGDHGSHARVAGRVLRLGATDVITTDRLHLLGAHNAMNALAASLAARAAGATIASIRKGLAGFRPLPYRLELVRTVRGVRYVNDTCATTPDGSIAAVRALDDGKGTMWLILGGADKELNYRGLSGELRRRADRIRVLLLPGTASPSIDAELRKRKIRVKRVEDLKSAVSSASERAIKGDIVILSPGAASFGQFANEFARGDRFNSLVKALK
jgi:UDP-N-acetylmuramoylalanine--D-glutamate ligase